MAETILTKSVAPGNWGAAFIKVTLSAADVGNQNEFLCTGKELIVAYNSGVAQRTCTYTSTNDPQARSGTITAETIEAGEVKIFGPVKNPGWMQSDTSVHIGANNAEVYFGIITLP